MDGKAKEEDGIEKDRNRAESRVKEIIVVFPQKPNSSYFHDQVSVLEAKIRDQSLSYQASHKKNERPP